MHLRYGRREAAAPVVQQAGTAAARAGPPGAAAAALLPPPSCLPNALPACRHHGGGVPEYWGKDSPYHGGTDFLGTPTNHLEVGA